MKPTVVQREEGKFDFVKADAFMDFAEANGLEIVAEETIDAIDRFLWSRPDIEVLDGITHWMA